MTSVPRNIALQALQQVIEELPAPVDETKELTQAQVMQILKMSEKGVNRVLTARGWKKRLARLSSGRLGIVWRMPDGD